MPTWPIVWLAPSIKSFVVSTWVLAGPTLMKNALSLSPMAKSPLPSPCVPNFRFETCRIYADPPGTQFWQQHDIGTTADLGNLIRLRDREGIRSVTERKLVAVEAGRSHAADLKLISQVGSIDTHVTGGTYGHNRRAGGINMHIVACERADTGRGRRPVHRHHRAVIAKYRNPLGIGS